MSTNILRCNRCFATVPSTTEAANEAWKREHMRTRHPEVAEKARMG